MKTYSVIVGNIGTVYAPGIDRREAYATYRDYCDQARRGYGRAAGETVTLLVDGEPAKEYRPRVILPLIKDIRALLVSLKADIGDEYSVEGDEPGSPPCMQVTIGANAAGEWSYQTGDNSYSGGAYHYPHWAVIYLTRRSNSTNLARDVVNQIDELQY